MLTEWMMRTNRMLLLAAALAGAGEAAAEAETWRPRERLCGFNLCGMFCKTKMAAGDKRIFGYFPEDRFRWMHDWGFNFARLPLDYRFFIKDGDWMKLDEAQLKKLDEAVFFGRRYSIHVNINFHRAPGYCCNPPKEPKSLFTDSEPLAAFTNLWTALAKRYRGIPNDELTFDLVNEPAQVAAYGCTTERYLAVAKAAIEAIHAADPDRFIMSDGFGWGRVPVRGLEPYRGYVGESMHCYEPFAVTHHGVGKSGPGDIGVKPVWPPAGAASGRDLLLKNFFGPWIEAERAGAFVHLGEFGFYREVPHATAMAWLEAVLRIAQERNWGWALWNLDGMFGIMDSGRTDCALEDFEGHRLDREALELLRKYSHRADWIGSADTSIPDYRDYSLELDVVRVKKGFTVLVRTHDGSDGDEVRFEEKDFPNGGRKLVVPVRGGAGGTFGFRLAADEEVVLDSIRAVSVNGRVLHEEEYFGEHMQETFFFDGEPTGKQLTLKDGLFLHRQPLPKNSARTRRRFTLPAKAVKATVYVTTPGFYELWLDGKPVDPTRVMAPVSTDKRLFTVEDRYEIAPLLDRGEHCLGFEVAPGYSDDFSRWGWRWLGPKCLRARVEIACEDGSRKTIRTGTDWEWSELGPVQRASIYHGETVDIRYDHPGWCRVSGGGWGWTAARTAVKVPQQSRVGKAPPIRLCERFEAKRITEPKPGVYVVDFGQNFAGVSELRISDGAAGTVIRVRHAEEVGEDGLLDVRSLRRAENTDAYVLVGDGREEVLRAHFTYHGFRYIEVTGWPRQLKPADVCAFAVHAAMKETATFESSDEGLNRLWNASKWSAKSNMLAFPSDCCQRMERTPCMADASMGMDIGMKMFDSRGFHLNYLENMRYVFETVQAHKCHPDWTCGTILLPWSYYQAFGDRTVLDREYLTMARQFERLKTLYPTDIVPRKYGDWLPPYNDNTWESFFSEPPLVNTAFYANLAKILADTAAALGKPEDEKRFLAERERIRAAFNREFWNAEKGVYTSGRMITYVLPLYFDLVPAERREAFVRKFLDNVRIENKGKIDVGGWGVRYIGELLCDLGEPELAVHMMTQPEYPGFGYMFANGATTLWEQWTPNGIMNTHNHLFLSGASNFLVNRLAGIRPAAPGYAETLIAPVVPKTVDRVSASLDTVNGKITSAWEKSADGGVRFTITVPDGMKARFLSPDGKSAELKSGENRFLK